MNINCNNFVDYSFHKNVQDKYNNFALTFPKEKQTGPKEKIQRTHLVTIPKLLPTHVGVYYEHEKENRLRTRPQGKNNCIEIWLG